MSSPAFNHSFCSDRFIRQSFLVPNALFPSVATEGAESYEFFLRRGDICFRLTKSEALDSCAARPSSPGSSRYKKIP